jgi:hypothetical protein
MGLQDGDPGVHCSCNESYTCDECQRRIDVENDLEYAREWRAWATKALLLIVKMLNDRWCWHLGEPPTIKLPDPPEPPRER